jgi:hypothetical protein
MRITDKNFPINFMEFDFLEFLKSHDFDFASKSFEQLFSLEMFFENHMTTVLQALEDNNDFDEYVLNVISFEKWLTTSEIKEFYEIKPKVESKSWERTWHPSSKSSNSTSQENLKGDENILWSSEIIRGNIDSINFLLLSSNPSMFWDYALIEEFEEYVVWRRFNDHYEEELAINRSSNMGLIYNKSVYWTKEIVDRWREKIDVFELTLNCQIETSVLWENRIELLEKKIYNKDFRGPRDDKEWVYFYITGWENVLSRVSMNFTSDLLSFLFSHELLNLCGGNNDYSALTIDDILKNQYSWLPSVILRYDFWETCLKSIISSNSERFKEVVKKKIESDFYYKIPVGSLVLDVVNQEEMECYKVVSDHESCFLGQRIVLDKDMKLIIEDYTSRIVKPSKFNSKHKIYILSNSTGNFVLDGKPAYYYYSLDEELYGEQSFFVKSSVIKRFGMSSRLSDILGS